MKIHARPAAGFLVLGLVLAACSGTSAAPTAGSGGGATQAAGSSQASSASTAPVASAGSGAAIDACALVTEQEASTFVGSATGPGINTGSADAPACFFGSLGISVDPTGGQAAYASKTSALQGTTNFVAISGVGDAAGATIVANTIADMEFVKGSVEISVVVQGDPSLQNITPAALTTLGTEIAGRL